MNPRENGKPESPDPEQLVRMLEIELAQKRAVRQRAGSPFRGFRLASFVFLFAVIVGVVIAFYYVFLSGGLDDLRTRKEPQPAASPASPTPK
jgi:hypothetical protein